jgi:polyhydroxybutyrate depolymerase
LEVWRKLNGCPEVGETVDLPDVADDGTTAKRTTYGPGREGAEVVLIEIENGGHTWPGKPGAVSLLGKSSGDVKANDLIWEFFEKHPMK